ncbi:MotA/TolQ/ExbB proton channel family protein [Marinobacter daepoensis]|uniref:MotA/TolQ/ExbB proton channel family protein n=1 Tax=Marinobacter daepoensis TaxID=262077 RepID=UPI001C9794F8|nr:MotA/TolQ/ExbB proton channel family protein [Marinobacter daepoensis]MBY6032594.1 MotA/TolQ/ExbB proton channel family protein [Marinobacter daepoensis]
MKRAIKVLVCLILAVPVQANELQLLLQEVRAEAVSDRAADTERIQAFKGDHDRQRALLEEARVRLAEAEQRQEELKQTFQDNEVALTEHSDRLRIRSGQLGEVFGVVKQQAQDVRGLLNDSMISAQYPDRVDRLSFADHRRIPTLSELEDLWFLLQQDMTATGQIATFSAPVVLASGETLSMNVVRVGPFTVVNDQGLYLNYQDSQLRVLPVQPDGGAVKQAQAFVAGTGDTLRLDPSRGNLLALLSQTPDLKARLAQGGLVGYLILALGALGLLVALWKLAVMVNVEFRIRGQIQRVDEPLADNPLGRVLLSGQQGVVPEDTELRVDEALLREAPVLERGLTLLKLVAAVAPLLGLLGTVTGMIGTFQSITLFGTGDPKLMAGGISQALMTTVLGLCVAIPLLFCHSLLGARCRRMLQLLQQKGLALLVDQQESRGHEHRHVA